VRTEAAAREPIALATADSPMLGQGSPAHALEEVEMTDRRRLLGEQGFTLIEVLVVTLIIGILAAIAIPSFLNQKGKANDAAAKELARTAQVTAEAYATENSGSYEGINQEKLNQLEQTIPFVESGNCTGSNACVKSASGTTKGYKIVAESPLTEDTFTVESSAGTVTRKCTGTGGGCINGAW
jgi:type IV pilus assembly protein PilA